MQYAFTQGQSAEPTSLSSTVYNCAHRGAGDLCDNIGLVGIPAKLSYVTTSPSHHDQAIPILSPLLFMHVGHLLFKIRLFYLLFYKTTDCFCMLHDFDLKIHVCLYSMIPEGKYELLTFLAHPRPNISAEGLHFSAFSFSHCWCVMFSLASNETVTAGVC